MLPIPNMQNIDYIIYDNDCNDSIVAAWSAGLKFPSAIKYMKENINDINYINKNILFLGIHIEYNKLIELSKLCNFIVLLESINLIENYTIPDDIINIYIINDHDRSSSQITWDFYFYGEIEFCWYVKFMAEKLNNNKINEKMIELTNEKDFLKII